MPMPEFRPERILPPASIPFAETVPASGYHAFVNFGGLILTVEAPCGCKMHYDTGDLMVQQSSANCLESCLREECEFEYKAAEEAALTALGEFCAHGPDYELGGEG